MTKRFTAALVGAPFGLTGRVKIVSVSGEERHLLNLQRTVLRQGTSEQEYAIEGVFTAPLSVKFAGIDSPEAVKALQGAEILVSRAAAAPLGQDEFYVEDLKGLTVYAAYTAADTAAAGQSDPPKAVGNILDIVEGGGGFLAEILVTSGEKRLVPFRGEFFGAVDPAAGRAELLVPWILD
ncbi:MAG: ribosome maturation factor RimM [Treponema sp.]|jgi:16S rRNA processing protein RimM|nr:ribosome maturation factor RimM [Treponema sp.]